jgi:hypothetical protein
MIPTSQPLPKNNPNSLPPARRRRTQRSLIPHERGQRAAFMDGLARHLTPSVFCGLVLGIAALLDAPALFILGALIAPFLSPVIGLSLATIFGSMRMFFQATGSLLLGGVLVFFGGAMGGLVYTLMPQTLPLWAAYFSHFSWPNVALLTLGASLTTFQAVRTQGQRPLIASVALAVELYIPLGVAGYGLASGLPGLWPDGVIVFLVHAAWSALIGVLVLAAMGLFPRGVFGYTLGSSMAIASLVAVVAVSSMGTAVATRAALPPLPSLTPTNTPSLTPSMTLTVTPTPPTPSLTPTRTLIPSKTPSLTLSPEPTPVWARINAGEFGGAVIRSEPNYDAVVVKLLANNMMVQVLPDIAEAKTVIWVKVRTEEGIEGWIVQSLLQTATPAPGW